MQRSQRVDNCYPATFPPPCVHRCMPELPWSCWPVIVVSRGRCPEDESPPRVLMTGPCDTLQ